MSSRLTLQAVKNAKPSGNRYVLWDSGVKGFGLRVNMDGTKTYLLKYVFGGRQRWQTIGKHGSPWTPDTARSEALKLLAQAKTGTDPKEAKKQEQVAERTVAEVCDMYVAAARAGQVLTKFDEPKKLSTLVTDEGRIQRHIKPLLGRKRVRDVTRDDIEVFLHDVASGKTAADVKTKPRGRAIVKGGRGTATRTVGLLGSIFAFAVKRRLRPDNPVRGVQRFRDRKHERFLSPAELKSLGAALGASERAWTAFQTAQTAWLTAGRKDKAPRPAKEAEDIVAINAIRLLLLTGARKSEILQLEWKQVDFDLGYLRLPTSKTGAKLIPLGAAAVQLLDGFPRMEKNPYVFPGSRTGRHFVGLAKVWERLRMRANIPDVRLHDLRHSFASVGAASGASLLLIGNLLGHKDPKTTQRYAHIAHDPAKATADQVAAAIMGALAIDDP